MPKIDKMFAFVIADSDPDDEGIPAFLTKRGTPMPMVGADLDRAESLMELAQEAADLHGKPIELRVFSEMKTVKVIQPR